MFLKKFKKIIKRHPFLYLTRFRLLSKDSNIAEIKKYSYNDLNSKEAIPQYFYDVNKVVFKADCPSADFDKVIMLCQWLKEHIKGGPGLSEPSAKALKTMLSGEGGVCSDVAQIFNNFCVINDIQVREWGTTTAPFNRDYGGHSFNEVYCKELKKWILIDVYWGFLFKDTTGSPLSVLELYELIRNDQDVYEESFVKIQIESGTVYKNYLNPAVIPFLICDYRNKVYDSFLKYTQPLVPIFVVHFMIYMLRLSYHYRFPIDDYKKIFS